MKWMAIILTIVMLSGCGIIDEFNKTVDYGNETKDYITTMVGYQDDLSTYLNKESLTEEDFENLKSMMDEIEGEVQSYSEVEPPGFAEGIHGEIEQQNDQILEAIDEANRQIDSGEFDQSAFENLEIVQSLQELKSYRDQVEDIMNNNE
ncbi:DUF6376 family protein [Aquisalibacillus elongatus]|uniref:Lipoprotein n=1 Tax=Aquisalibacillus elongatus TaxID=485577 RepID=A0A3N5BW29_9BACI|nr:DUF6376 family protein [Aquisalibacillus elongatus]RPF53998.1 hypothetical protein EDC24_1186 [Aquisalibacillus elongatus]